MNWLLSILVSTLFIWAMAKDQQVKALEQRIAKLEQNVGVCK